MISMGQLLTHMLTTCLLNVSHYLQSVLLHYLLVYSVVKFGCKHPDPVVESRSVPPFLTHPPISLKIHFILWFVAQSSVVEHDVAL